MPGFGQWILLIAGLVLFPLSSVGVSIAWNADAGSDIAGYKLYYGSASGVYTNVTDVGNVTAATVSGLINGITYYFAATAYDTIGLESVYSSEVSYTVPVTNGAPSIVLASPPNGASYSAPATVNLTANVTANGHTITQVQFYTGTTLLGSATAAPYSFTWNNVAAGNFSLSAQLVYDSGNTLKSSAVSLIVTNPPPRIALTSPASGATYQSPATVNLAASVTPNGHSITSVQFFNGASLLGSATAPPYTFSWANVSAGAFSVSAKLLYDSGSTVASSSAAITVTNPLPTIALTSPLNGASYSAPAVINLAAKVVANGHSITQVQFHNGSSLLGEMTTAPYTMTWSNVSAGNFSLTASVLFDSGGIISSTPANITVSGLPTPWQTADIGSVGMVGNASYNSSAGIFTVAGSGTGIGSTLDGFRLVWQVASGDCSITARVTGVQDTASMAKAGVMIRETLNANSRSADLVMTPVNGAYFQWRSRTGGESGGAQSSAKTAPYWVRVTRAGSTFRGYISSDGATWTQLGNSRSISMASSIYIGLCVTAQNSSALNTSTFSNVSAVP